MDLTNYAEVTALLERHGFRFSKSLGQNFLTAAWVPERIAEEAGLTRDDCVLEVGPGVGCLTAALSDRAGKVVSLELDRRLESVLKETLAGRDNVEVIFADAGKTDLKKLCKLKGPDRPWKVCANLPYNVTTPLLTAFLKAGCFESVTVMVQKEVAERLCARPGTGEYGAFTLLVQWYARPELLFEVPPICFVPQPKVTSAVVRLERLAERPVPVKDEELFFRTVRAAFNQRRKTLSNALRSAFPGLDREALNAALEELGLSVTVRGEALSLAQFAALSDALYDMRKEEFTNG
ncbi:MAG: 16S rRNA (adenine(1518)-N(6)/adenine(1519)-N(6))-dimethyltransferase RsmA [Oscillospiraceae bacterium]|nr:16S rRNA (adenine(1518)-N(6)/adenine(1519)-N(6))-dimethyltransferase RsmA [Oscillospiraceae bacterium]